MRIRFVITLALALTTMPVMVPVLFATDSAKPGGERIAPSSAEPLPAPSPAPERPKPAGGQGEGIGVRGQWTIEIRNPDGTIATRREFKNALTADGQTYLAHLLARRLAPGPWLIRLGGAPSPCRTSTENLDCILSEARAARLASSNLAKTLTVTPPPTPAITSLTLGGFIVVPFDGSITSVASSLEQCPPTVLVSRCLSVTTPGVTQPGLPPPLPPSFTEATIPAIPVTAGQQVAAGVVFTFSTAP